MLCAKAALVLSILSLFLVEKQLQTPLSRSSRLNYRSQWGGEDKVFVNELTEVQKEAEKMSNAIAVTIQSPQPSLLGGPVPVFLTVANPNAEPAKVLLPYPSPNNLSFRCMSNDVALPKPIEPDPVGRAAPMLIQPGGKYTATYFLNRYFKFTKAGNAVFSYDLRVFVSAAKEATSKSEKFTGSFEVQILADSDDRLRGEFAARAAQLESSNRQTKMEAAESLAYIDSNLVVPYLLPMLQIDNLEVIGIGALGRHPSPKSAEAIASMLTRQDSAVVSAALGEIGRLNLPVRRQQVLSLLTSRNPNIRLVGLEWLAARPDPGDIQYVVALIHDQNELVQKRAKQYVEFLQGSKTPG